MHADSNCQNEDDVGAFCSDTCKVLRDAVINACPAGGKTCIYKDIDTLYILAIRVQYKTMAVQ